MDRLEVVVPRLDRRGDPRVHPQPTPDRTEPQRPHQWRRWASRRRDHGARVQLREHLMRECSVCKTEVNPLDAYRIRAPRGTPEYDAHIGPYYLCVECYQSMVSQKV